MIGKSRRQKLVSEINITPFTDVILVLLIIFMITTPLISQSGLKVKLPEAKSATPMKGKEQAEITITNEGMVYLEEKLVTRKELKERMGAIYLNNSNIAVVLKADKLVNFKEIVGVLDVLNALGIKNLNIAAIAEQ
ncbi:MAG: biopolymer transporter ExbD [Candidatus Omnitrophica bacterium]|jgi:TonB system transport protein ExbD (group 2)|nr:biopolymer transporter ExbD [Candidatus Omnitrophota bacterium]